MTKGNGRYHLLQKIETLREELHRQTDFTRHDALKISAELDQLILEAMKTQDGNRPG
ncbi:MAG TPA: aspartyl-phosphate phosphatase Spo0E family protein [Firmicutes bacterium]|jgi:hypothetical protein|nr:aspartyl-phosphate phosphatase Spo0E family protein [Bacillota bacterium]